MLNELKMPSTFCSMLKYKFNDALIFILLNYARKHFHFLFSEIFN